MLVDGVHVGFLAAEDARTWQPVLVECERRGLLLVGSALFVGSDPWGIRLPLRDNLPGFTGPVTTAAEQEARQA